MQEIQIHSYARQLLEAHGAKAIAELPRTRSISKQRARSSWPGLGGISKTP